MRRAEKKVEMMRRGPRMNLRKVRRRLRKKLHYPLLLK